MIHNFKSIDEARRARREYASLNPPFSDTEKKGIKEVEEWIEQDKAMKKTETETRDRVKKMKRMYYDAIQVQDACNLSGVVFSFARHMQTLCDMGLDTDAKNLHPVSILFVDKLADLAGRPGYSEFHDAYQEAKNYAFPKEEVQSFPCECGHENCTKDEHCRATDENNS